MQIPVPFSPDQASSYASDADNLYAFLWTLTIVFGTGLVIAIFYFAIKYRRRSPNEVGHPVAGAITLVGVAALFFVMRRKTAQRQRELGGLV